MTTRRRLILLAATITVAATVGGLVYTRTRGHTPDDAGAKADDTPLPAHVTKATTPARKLTDREMMLVGRWKLERITPTLLSPNFKATAEYLGDGTWTLQTSEETLGLQVRHGTFRLIGDMHVTKLEGDETSTGLIEELTDHRLVKSFQDGSTHWVMEWSRQK